MIDYIDMACSLFKPIEAYDNASFKELEKQQHDKNAEITSLSRSVSMLHCPEGYIYAIER